MRVALDAIPLVGAKSGVGHYTAALAEWLARIHTPHQYDLLSPFDFKFETHNGHGKPENLNRQYLPVRGIFRRWWVAGLPTLLRISPVDLFHGTNYCVPLFAPCATVVTIHDMSLFAQADTHELDNVRRGKRRMPAMARRADRIITDSDNSKREIIEYLGIDADKIHRVHLAARQHIRPLNEPEFRPVLERLGIREPYLLFVGTIEPRKNLATLIRAYDDLIHSTEHCPQLVLCGGRGWLCDSIYELVDKLKLGEMVKFTGYVDDDDLPALYSGAEAFVYLSHYEGFGLPPLEAMACGTPVISSNATSLPEVIGDAGLMLAPQDQSGLTAALTKLLDDAAMRDHYRRAGIERNKLFSWDRAARETQAVYDLAFTEWQRKHA
jgi:glycosyltransferase involved in cell wall biosynthesis